MPESLLRRFSSRPNDAELRSFSGILPGFNRFVVPTSRWCRCAQPPANCCSPSGTKTNAKPYLAKIVIRFVVQLTTYHIHQTQPNFVIHSLLSRRSFVFQNLHMRCCRNGLGIGWGNVDLENR